jgi:hypothetical protein
LHLSSLNICIHLLPLQQIQLRYKQTWGQMEQGTTQQVCLDCLIEKGGTNIPKVYEQTIELTGLLCT